MMKIFRESEEIVGLVSLGCCYMKLSTREDSKGCVDQRPSSLTEALGYPLSEFVCSLLSASSLSYEAREVACHSIDSYSKQLQQGTDFILVCACSRFCAHMYMRAFMSGT